MFKKDAPPKDIHCLNCETRFGGWFCPHCGQKSATRRLSVTTVTKDFMDAVSDSDRGFVRTSLDLSRNPGRMLRDYMAGKRQRYLSAGKYTFFIVVAFTINVSLLEGHFGFFEQITGMVNQLSVTQAGDAIHISDANTQANIIKEKSTALKIDDANLAKIQLDVFGLNVNKRASKKEILEFISLLLPQYHQSLFNFLKIFIILWIPLFSLFSYLFFRKCGYNFAEHITINSFIYSHLLLISMLLSTAYWIFPGMAGTTLFLTCASTSFYLLYAYLQLFEKASWRLSKAIFSTGFSSFSYLVVLMALMISQIVYVAVINIEKL